MPNGNAKPISMIKGHRTKAELALRKKGEEALYTGETIKESPEVKQNKIAHAEFSRLAILYSSVKCVDALDQPIINRYCMETANQAALRDRIERLENELNKDDIEWSDRMNIWKLIATIEAQMIKGKEFLLKYEDRLFMNPVSRIKSIPKTPEEKPAVSGVAAYRARREGNDAAY